VQARGQVRDEVLKRLLRQHRPPVRRLPCGSQIVEDAESPSIVSESPSTPHPHPRSRPHIRPLRPNMVKNPEMCQKLYK
jgi:hypothetical protein